MLGNPNSRYIIFDFMHQIKKEAKVIEGCRKWTFVGCDAAIALQVQILQKRLLVSPSTTDNLL
jgi:hypothetical protein